MTPVRAKRHAQNKLVFTENTPEQESFRAGSFVVCRLIRSAVLLKDGRNGTLALASVQFERGIMGLCVGYDSAYGFWRQADDARAALLQVGSARSSYEITRLSSFGKADRADIERARAFGFDAMPLHIVAADDQARLRCAGVVCHRCSASLPRGSVVSLGEGLFVASPALTFLHMAESLSVEELVAAGSVLCGRYRIMDDGSVGERSVLETPARLASFVGRASGMRGAPKARRALRFVVDDSASPMETALALLLCLPPLLGGYGLPKPVMNMRIDAVEYGRHMTGGGTDARFFRGDLCWPQAKLCVEYDSDAYHTGSQRIAHDSWRRAELELAGFMVVTVTKGQLYDRKAMDRLARLLAKRLGARVRRRDAAYEERQMALRRVLLWRNSTC